MDTPRLRREFGKYLVFWGAVDTQRVLPQGTPEDVRAEVVRRVRDLRPGYIPAPVHNIQAEVPPENIVAMFEVLKNIKSV
jgi:uroporphyrinogen decarboxylase